MFKRRHRKLRNAAKECLDRRFAQIEQQQTDSGRLWPSHLNGSAPSACATAAVANLAHLRRAGYADGAGHLVLEHVDDQGRIACSHLGGYSGLEIITHALLFLRPLNLGRHDSLKRALEGLVVLVDLKSGNVEAALSHDPADADRIIPIALVLTVLSLYQEGHEFATPIGVMRTYLFRRRDPRVKGAWKLSKNGSRPVGAGTTALILTALLCSGTCDRDMVIASIEFILGQQGRNGSWSSLEEGVVAPDSGRSPLPLNYNTHAAIVRAICLALNELPPRLERRCRKALLKLLRYLVQEQRDDPGPKPDDRQTMLSPDAITRMAQNLITITVICDLVFKDINHYETWRFQPSDRRAPSQRQGDAPRSFDRALRSLGLIVSLVNLFTRLLKTFH